MRQMKVDKLGIDLLTHDPVVILKDMDGKRFLPILIGPFEATAIALALEGAPVPRPLTHDLMRTVFETLQARLEQVVIHDIRESTFFAKLIVRTNGEVQEIDARPSDGIALALRMSAPIYVSDKIVLEESVPDKKTEEAEVERFKKFIEDLKALGFQPVVSSFGYDRLWDGMNISPAHASSAGRSRAEPRNPTYPSGRMT